jgi:hypothetical protein
LNRSQERYRYSNRLDREWQKGARKRKKKKIRDKERKEE